ncbi:MAG TPA: hypothetical protein VKV96_02890 [Roseiarcus sp.]|nr:hypothetical protein [Roseiarcus sp.]
MPRSSPQAKKIGSRRRRGAQSRRVAALVASIFAGAAIIAASYYLLNRGQSKPDRRSAAVASNPSASPAGESRSLASGVAPIAAEEPARARKIARKELPSAAQDDTAIDQWFMAAYLRCWSPPAKIPSDGDYAAKIRVSHNANGSLAGAPILVNPPSDPDWRSYADSAVRAVKKCNPLSVPAEYLPRFDHWRKVTLYFAPDSAR